MVNSEIFSDFILREPDRHQYRPNVLKFRVLSSEFRINNVVSTPAFESKTRNMKLETYNIAEATSINYNRAVSTPDLQNLRQ